MQCFKGLYIKKRTDAHFPHPAQPAEIVSQQIDDHDIFTAVLDISTQGRGYGMVLTNSPPSPDRSFHRPDNARISCFSKKKLRRK